MNHGVIMSPLRVIATATLALVVSILPAVIHAAETSSTRPNIIMIYTDDMGYGDVSAFASKPLKVKTPNIDRMALEGKKFTQFYVAMPICSPSRAAVLSGTFSPRNQLTNYLQERKGNVESDQNDYMDPTRAYLPKSFKAAGYATGHIGKWHLGGGRDVENAPSILKYGYDEAYSTWESPNRDPKLGTIYAPWDKRTVPGQVARHERTAYMVDKTLDFMKRHGDKPCFITLWPDDMHTPFRPSPEMMKKHGGKEGEDNSIENFHAVLEEYDRQIGRLMDGIKSSGADANTIVFFTSDNGPAPTYNHQRTDGMRGMKLSLYEGGIREPFIIRWPGKISPGTTNNETVMSTVDLLPTLTSLAGIDVIAEGRTGVDGEDMSRAILTNEPVKRTKALLFEYGRTARVPRPKKDEKDRSPVLAIRDGDLKLLVSKNNKVHQLYDIPKDRFEQHNLAKDDRYTTIVEQLSERVIKWSNTLPHRTQPYQAD